MLTNTHIIHISRASWRVGEQPPREEVFLRRSRKLLYQSCPMKIAKTPATVRIKSPTTWCALDILRVWRTPVRETVEVRCMWSARKWSRITSIRLPGSYPGVRDAPNQTTQECTAEWTATKILSRITQSMAVTVRSNLIFVTYEKKKCFFFLLFINLRIYLFMFQSMCNMINNDACNTIFDIIWKIYSIKS